MEGVVGWKKRLTTTGPVMLVHVSSRRVRTCWLEKLFVNLLADAPLPKQVVGAHRVILFIGLTIAVKVDHRVEHVEHGQPVWNT